MNFIIGITLLLLSLFVPVLVNAEITCPNGSFQRIDENGNIICLDNTKRFPVDPIVTPDEIQITDEQSGYVIIGVIIFIIIIAVIATASRKKSESKPLGRRGWSDSQHKQVLNRQNGRCAICGEVSGTFQFDHKDDNNNNNDLDNCQALCPNCHDRKSRGLD